MVRTMHNTPMSDTDEEAVLAKPPLGALEDDVHKFLRGPVDGLLPSAIAGGPGSAKKASGLRCVAPSGRAHDGLRRTSEIQPTGER